MRGKVPEDASASQYPIVIAKHRTGTRSLARIHSPPSHPSSSPVFSTYHHHLDVKPTSLAAYLSWTATTTTQTKALTARRIARATPTLPLRSMQNHHWIQELESSGGLQITIMLVHNHHHHIRLLFPSSLWLIRRQWELVQLEL